MSRLSQRLNAYQTQMSIYAEQHKIVLASDVMGMIEQLQDDLQDDIRMTVEQLEDEDMVSEVMDEVGCARHDAFIKAIEIVQKGGTE